MYLEFIEILRVNFMREATRRGMGRDGDGVSLEGMIDRAMAEALATVLDQRDNPGYAIQQAMANQYAGSKVR